MTGAWVTQSIRALPRELPPDVYAFAGRAGELAELDRILDEGNRATVIVAVSGTAGVGKPNPENQPTNSARIEPV